jgi:hypothetical protein
MIQQYYSYLILPAKLKISVPTQARTQMFKVALFKRDKRCKQPKYPPADKWEKMSYIHATNH